MELPSLTQENLDKIDTPQFKAFEWLADHPELENLPVWKMKQLFALVTFYHAMDGNNWFERIQGDWLRYDKDECLWFSTEFGYFVIQDDGPPIFIEYEEGEYQNDHVYNPEGGDSILPCNDNGKFQSLALSELGLGGFNPFIPPEISMLSSLTYLTLLRNGINVTLSDFVPAELFEMTSLRVFSFHINQMTGTIPSEFGLMTNLVSFSVSSNQLTGTLPTELCDMTSLLAIFLNGNSLNGTIPSEVGKLTDIDEGFYIHWNEMSGTIPSELGRLTSTLKLQLFGNRLTGTIPTELGLLTEMNTLYLDANLLSGPVPTEFGGLVTLQKFVTHFNDLTGAVPTELGNCANISLLSLNDNQLTGTIPSELGLVSAAELVFLQNNLLSGSLPDELWQMTNLTLLDVSGMPFMFGPLPFELMPSSLRHLNVEGGNQLSGTIPDDLCVHEDPECRTGLPWDPKNCTIAFECSEYLCGCDCPCSGNQTWDLNSTI